MDSRPSGEKSSSRSTMIATGIALTAAFGIAFLVTLPWGWFFVFPLVFAGVLPLVKGLAASPRSRSTVRRVPAEPNSAAARERKVLQAARDEQGIITPTVVALKSDLSIKDAETVLEEMARKGYALMRVTDSGRVEYEFPEFLPRIEDAHGGAG